MATIKEFLNANRHLDKSFLELHLGVSRATLNRHCGSEPKMMQLALSELNNRERKYNRILLDVTAHQDSSGNTYFAGYCEFHGKVYKMDYTYGYGSYCEQYAIECLFELGLLETKDAADLRRHYNITIDSTVYECRRKKEMYFYDGRPERNTDATFR